jgi:hypothetical protein
MKHVFPLVVITNGPVYMCERRDGEGEFIITDKRKGRRGRGKVSVL